jgi:hypothetical protein
MDTGRIDQPQEGALAWREPHPLSLLQQLRPLIGKQEPGCDRPVQISRVLRLVFGLGAITLVSFCALNGDVVPKSDQIVDVPAGDALLRVDTETVLGKADAKSQLDQPFRA